MGEAVTAKRPSMQYPRWLIDRYATIRYKSDWAHAASEAKTIEQSASPSSHGPRILISCGKSGSSRRTKPYTPIFESTPVNTIEAPTGALSYASGSQV